MCVSVCLKKIHGHAGKRAAACARGERESEREKEREREMQSISARAIYRELERETEREQDRERERDIYIERESKSKSDRERPMGELICTYMIRGPIKFETTKQEACWLGNIQGSTAKPPEQSRTDRLLSCALELYI